MLINASSNLIGTRVQLAFVSSPWKLCHLFASDDDLFLFARHPLDDAPGIVIRIVEHALADVLFPRVYPYALAYTVETMRFAKWRLNEDREHEP